jgi:hypothetical protein
MPAHSFVYMEARNYGMYVRHGQVGHHFGGKRQSQWGIRAMSAHTFVYINIPSKLRGMT